MKLLLQTQNKNHWKLVYKFIALVLVIIGFRPLNRSSSHSNMSWSNKIMCGVIQIKFYVVYCSNIFISWIMSDDDQKIILLWISRQNQCHHNAIRKNFYFSYESICIHSIPLWKGTENIERAMKLERQFAIFHTNTLLWVRN